MRYIGDIHGDFKYYQKVTSTCEKSIQVGDFGIGFVKNPIYDYDVNNHRFIRGNHDYPEGCYKEPNFIPDGTIEGDTMFMGGAMSIDIPHRTEGVDWWRDEECSYSELSRLYEKYVKHKPKIVVTHDCPEFVSTIMCNEVNFVKFDLKSITRNAYQNMWEEHKPDLWIFGHWHLDFRKEIFGTEFVCVNCLKYLDI
ncbi:MAG: hypothetical protein COA52_00630 [Hyphomicrobiales bacterium]|nr:MAG: hypothetical protein COA52_00630 [Hyphomicrobiales bacterium]